MASGSISARKAHTHKALKAALMPRLRISLPVSPINYSPSTGARERRHRGWASKIGLHSAEERPDKERVMVEGGRWVGGRAVVSLFVSALRLRELQPAVNVLQPGCYNVSTGPHTQSFPPSADRMCGNIRKTVGAHRVLGHLPSPDREHDIQDIDLNVRGGSQTNSSGLSIHSFP